MANSLRIVDQAGFDLAGAARDLDERAQRYAPIYAQPDVAVCVRLIHRNPAIASTVRRAIESELAQLPGGGVGLEQPLFDASRKVVSHGT